MEYVTEREVAQRYGVKLKTVQKWRRLKVGPAYHRIEGSIRYSIADLEAYDKSRRVETESPSQ